MGITATTWDPASSAKGANVTLSSSNSIATVTSGTGSVAGTNRISGLTYGEYLIGATLTGSARVGLVFDSFTFTNLLGVDLNGIGYDSGGTVKINNATVATIMTFTASDRIGWAYDPFNKLIWFRKNNGNWNNDVIGNQNPVGAVGGISTSTLTGGGFGLKPGWGGSATSSITGKWASGTWTDTAPSGFSQIDTQGSSVVNGAVSYRSATYSQYGAINAYGAQASQRVSSLGAKRSAVTQNGWYGYNRLWSPAATQTNVSGNVQQNGVNAPNKLVCLYAAATGELLGTALSDASGNFTIPALGRTNVYAVAQDPSFQALVYDQVTPV